MKTLGTLTRKEGKWVLEAQPHVVIRAKRLFPRISRSQHGKLHLKDTPEVCAELAWFRLRFPLDVSDEDYLLRRSAGYHHRVEQIALLLQGQVAAQDFELAIPARDYQRVAADMLLKARGLLLADDLGIGKTVSAIAAITKAELRPALVVTLTHLPKQWERELQRFAPGLKTHILKSTVPYALPEGTDVILTSYSKIAKWSEALAGQVKSVTFDECQELRTGAGAKKEVPAKYSAAVYIASMADFRLGLSATPIYNYGIEIWSVMNVLHPDALGTKGEFIDEWCVDAAHEEKARIKEPAAFGSYMRSAGLMLRRTRGDVGRELPKLTKIPHVIDVDEKVLEQGTRGAAELAKILLTQGERGFDKMRAAEEFSMIVRQATGLAKAPFVAEFVRLLVESGEKVLLYGWHHGVYEVWREKLENVGIKFFTGRESQAQKQEALDLFKANDARCNVLAMSLRAGQGIDGLQHVCSTVVFGELDWSPGVHEQCEGRVDRDMQKRAVMAYYLLSDSGSDPVVSDVLGVKRAQIEGLRDPEGKEERHLMGSDKDLRKLAEAFLRERGLPIPKPQVQLSA